MHPNNRMLINIFDEIHNINIDKILRNVRKKVIIYWESYENI